MTSAGVGRRPARARRRHPEVRTGTPGKARPSSSAVRRAPTTDERSSRPPQCRHSNRPHAASAPAAGGLGRRDASATGPPQCAHAHGRAAGLAGQRGHVAAARAPARGPGRTRGPPWRCATRATGGGPTRPPRRARPRRPRRRPGRAGPPRAAAAAGDGPQLAGLDQLLRPRPCGRSRPTARRRPRPRARVQRARRGRAGRARGARRAGRRRRPTTRPEPRSRTGAKAAARVPTTHRHVAAQHLEPGGVARLRTLVGGEPDVPTRARGRAVRARVDAVDVAVVGTRPGRCRARRRPRSRRPPRPAPPASPASVAALGQRQPRRRRAPRRPRARDRKAGPAAYLLQAGPGPVGHRQRVGGRRLERQGLLGGGVPRGDGQAQHVAERRRRSGRRPRVATCSWSGVRTGSGDDDPADRREPPVVLGVRPGGRRRSRRGPARRTAP